MVRSFNLRDRRPDVDAFFTAEAGFVSYDKACKALAAPT